jgi:histidinol dehydrogenase
MDEILGTVRVSQKTYSKDAARVRERTLAPPDVAESVEEIVRRVRAEGDKALSMYVKSLDGAELDTRGFRVSQSEMSAAARSQSPELLKALRNSLDRIRKVQGSLVRGTSASIKHRGFRVTVRPKPLPSVGCYVPGGRASYASSVLMTAGVAKLAGVERVVLCTPAGKDGSVNPAILAAATIAGVDELYRIGGAHAIAAMAYGTESVRKVEKIVGPGGRYVSAAKRLVSRDVSTDFYAGPTEIVVLADDSCEPAVAGWELMGQAEHGEDTLCGLVTFSEDYATSVRAHIRRTLPGLERREYVEASLRRGFAAVCSDEKTAFDFVNAIAPEHLAVMTRNPGRAATRIHGAGLKLLGRYSPCAASDYLVGTDHVIPTAGLASAKGPLSVLDFVKLDWTVTGSSSGLRELMPALRELTKAEGLPNHYLSARARLED